MKSHCSKTDLAALGSGVLFCIRMKSHCSKTKVEGVGVAIQFCIRMKSHCSKTAAVRVIPLVGFVSV